VLGSDCEKTLGGISSIKNALIAGIHALAGATSYQITTTGTHGELEVPVPVAASSFTSGAISAMGSISGELSKIKSMGQTLYADIESFNNSYGSPWKELDDMQAAINALSGYGTLNFVGEKAALLADMNAALSEVIDARHVFIIYQDYIQRGFDNLYNANKPSITFQKDNEKETIGNVDQEYEENVKIPIPSYDPF